MANTIIKKFNDDYFEIVHFKYGIPHGGKTKTLKSFSTDDEIKRCSISRTKRIINDYIICNDFNYFCTWTLKNDMGIEVFKDKLTKKIQNYNYRNSTNIKYIVVFEKGEKTNRLHAHGVISEVPQLYKNEHGYLSSKLFDSLGFQSFSIIKNKIATSRYINKYITKSIDFCNGRRFLSSKGLKSSSQLKQFDVQSDMIRRDFENDFLVKGSMNRSELSLFLKINSIELENEID